MTNIFKPNNKVKLFLAFLLAIILTLGLSLSLQSVAAAVLSTPYRGVQLGNASYSLSGADNLIWGVVDPSSTGSYMLLQKSGSPYSNMFRVDASGNVTAAGNITAAGNMTVAGQDVCREDGVNCPTVAASQWLANGSNIYYNTGNVGIGIANPSSPLTVKGNSNRAQLTVIGAPNQTAANPVIQTQQSDGTKTFEVYADSYANYFMGLDVGKNTIPTFVLLTNITSGQENIALGNKALYSNTYGSSNIAIGNLSLYSNIGQRDNTVGVFNIALGHSALNANTRGADNIALGHSALLSNTLGNFNVAVGNQSLIANQTGIGNTALGDNAARNVTAGFSNTAVGGSSLYVNNGSYNTAVGYLSLGDNTAGSNNTVVGYNTGRGIITGGNNTIIGANIAGLAAGLSNNIIIADGAGNQRINVVSNGNVGIGTVAPAARLDLGQLLASTEGLKIKIGATAPYSPLAIVKADGTDAFRVKENGNVGIGTTSPLAKLSIKGTGATTGRLLQITDSNDVEKVTILDNGNVGIGAATPGALLALRKDEALSANPTAGLNRIIIENQGAWGSSRILFKGYSNQNMAAIDQLDLGAGGDSALTFWTHTNSGDVFSEKMRITNTGKVGIGTAAPGAKLDLGQLPASTEGLRIKIGATTPFSPLAIIKADGTDAFRVKEDGNIGIGTTNPGAKLEVAGQVKITGGTPGVGKVLTSDDNGLASWQPSIVISQNYSAFSGENSQTDTNMDLLSAGGVCFLTTVKPLASAGNAITQCMINKSSTNWVLTAASGNSDVVYCEAICIRPSAGVFTQPMSYTLAVVKMGSGSGTVSGGGINCGSTCSTTLASGATVTLLAAPAAGSVFSGWSGACTGIGACTVTMDAAKTVVASFMSNPPYTLTVAKSGSGTGTVSGGGINCGLTCSTTFSSITTVTLQATAAANSYFAGWSGACTGYGSCTVTMDASKTVTASFIYEYDPPDPPCGSGRYQCP